VKVGMIDDSQQPSSTSLLSPKELRRLVRISQWGKHLQKGKNSQFEAPCAAYEQAIHRGVEEGRRARSKVWLANRGLVKMYVSRINFSSYVIDRETLEQAGEIGLGIAIDKFDPDNGAAFSTYAFWWIQSKVKICLMDLRDIRLPSHIGVLTAKVAKCKNADEKRKVIKESKHNRRTIDAMLFNLNGGVISLDQAFKSNEDSDWHDILGSVNNVESDAIYNLTVGEIQSIFEKSGLTETHRNIIYMALGIKTGEPLRIPDITPHFSYNRERIRQIIKHGLLYLRSDMKILALDPGKTTGYILYEPDTRTILERGELELFDRVDDLISLADFVIYESFGLFEHKAKDQIGSEFEACQVIGVIKYFLKKTGRDYVVQKPSDQIFFDDKKLAKLNMRSKSNHINSATKHLLMYLLRTKDQWLIQRLHEMAA
jgi:DNA-directed RNA polymerase sigma subunit (sigma70/sigma32)